PAQLRAGGEVRVPAPAARAGLRGADDPVPGAVLPAVRRGPELRQRPGRLVPAGDLWRVRRDGRGAVRLRGNGGGRARTGAAAAQARAADAAGRLPAGEDGDGDAVFGDRVAAARRDGVRACGGVAAALAVGAAAAGRRAGGG